MVSTAKYLKEVDRHMAKKGYAVTGHEKTNNGHWRVPFIAACGTAASIIVPGTSGDTNSYKLVTRAAQCALHQAHGFAHQPG